MNQPATIAGYRILDGRYALLDCIAISTVGKIYRGRDLERAKVQGMDSHVLIHFLPRHLNELPLETLFQQVTQTCKQVADSRILPLRSYGQEQDKRYLVMDSPATAAITSLEQKSSSQNPTLFKDLSRLIQPLHKQGLLTAHIDAALVITDTSHSLYLLGSALSPQIQALQSRHAVLSGKRKPVGAIAAGLAVLGLISAISVMAANYMLEPSPTISVTPPTAKPLATEGDPGTAPMQLASLTPAVYGNNVNLANSDRVIQTADTDLLEQQAAPTETKEVKVQQPEVKPKSSQAVKPVPKKTSQPAEKSIQKAKAATTTKAGKKPVDESAKPVKPEPRPQIITRPAPKQEAGPETLGINELISLAEQAMNNGRFTGQNSALTYTRLLRNQSRLHPQVKRLSRAIVAHYHNQARAYLQNNAIKATEQSLAVSVSIIKEFNLMSFNDAQQVLEHKAASLKPAY